MKTANLAIVFTDIKGFTERTSRQTLEENQRLLATHSELLAPLFRAFGGKIVKSIGDAFLVTFDSPTQAVLCGVAIQDRLWQHNQAAAEVERFEVRIAINVGEVRLEGNDVFGEPVNIASRVEGIAEAGEVYFTEAVYLSMNKAEVPSEEVGGFELKGIPGKIRVFRVPHGPYRVEAAGAASGTAQPPFGNLGLSRVPGDLSTKARELGTQAAELGGGLVAKTSSSLARLKPMLPRVGLPSVAAVLALGLTVWGLSSSSVERAIAAAASASPQERPAKLEAAKKAIAEVESPSEQRFLTGRLAEALGDPEDAIRSYRHAARSDHGPSVDRLIDLLEHERCGVRKAAADTLGELKIARARSALEDLAENGGPGEEEDPSLLGLLGCRSKAAAKDALERLK